MRMRSVLELTKVVSQGMFNKATGSISNTHHNHSSQDDFVTTIYRKEKEKKKTFLISQQVESTISRKRRWVLGFMALS